MSETDAYPGRARLRVLCRECLERANANRTTGTVLEVYLIHVADAHEERLLRMEDALDEFAAGCETLLSASSALSESVKRWRERLELAEARIAELEEEAAHD